LIDIKHRNILRKGYYHLFATFLFAHDLLKKRNSRKRRNKNVSPLFSKAPGTGSLHIAEKKTNY